MSVRIYTLSKQLELSNKEVIALLQQRGFKVDSPSNTIPDDDAEVFIKELALGNAKPSGKPQPSSEKAGQAPVAQSATASTTVDFGQGKEKSLSRPSSQILPPAAAVPTKDARPSLSNFVKSATQVAEERELRMPQKPMMAPPVPPRPIAANSAAIPPAPVQANSAPRVPFRPTPPPFAFNKTPPIPSTLTQKPVEAPASSGAEEQAASKLIQLKPPIVVRDFAVLLGLKPFRLISELMEMGIFVQIQFTTQMIFLEMIVKLSQSIK